MASSSASSSSSRKTASDINIFPSVQQRAFVKIDTPEGTRKELENFVKRPDMKTTVVHQISGKIYFKLAHHADGRTKELRVAYFFNALKEATKYNREVHPKKGMCWSNVSRRLTNAMNTNRKNTDPRTCFSWNGYFLVPKFFTFGQITVGQGECHLFQTLNVPLLFYVLTADKKTALHPEDHPPLVQKRCFVPGDQHWYHLQVVKGMYVVPSGTTYLAMAHQKTLFTVTLLPSDAVLPEEAVVLSTVFLKETKARKAEENARRYRISRDPYVVPPETPSADQMTDMPPPSVPPAPFPCFDDESTFQQTPVTVEMERTLKDLQDCDRAQRTAIEVEEMDAIARRAAEDPDNTDTAKKVACVHPLPSSIFGSKSPGSTAGPVPTLEEGLNFSNRSKRPRMQRIFYDLVPSFVVPSRCEICARTLSS